MHALPSLINPNFVRKALRLLLPLAWLMASAPGHALALAIGLALDPLDDDVLTQEWAWALRGGGADFRFLRVEELASPTADLGMLILDSIPLRKATREGIDQWVQQGGILIYADAQSATQEETESGQFVTTPDVLASDLLGVRLSGVDLGQQGNYPYIVASTPILSPLLQGDGIRLGIDGTGQNLRLESTTAKVLARGARLSPGPGSLVLKSETPTIFVNDRGQGKVLFLTFSPGQVAACYPAFRENRVPRDCSGAANAHALMRWIVPDLISRFFSS